MDCSTPHPHQLNPHSQTLFQNPSNHIKQSTQRKAMEKFQQVILKLAETHPNAPLSPARKTLLQDRLNQFVSQYKTPDHPPYSAMIERAIRELNEKRGSSEDSISRFLEKEYDNLPRAHLVLLKHHLGQLCKSGDIVMTRKGRYMLAGENENPVLNSSTKVEKKPPRKKKWRWRWDWERERNKRRKKELIKKRNQHKGKKVKVIEKHQEFDEKERQLTENRVHIEDEQVKNDQTTRLSSCVLLPTELTGMTETNEEKYSDEVRSQEQEIGTSEILKDDISAAHTQDLLERQQSEYTLPEISSPGRPPGFESITIENLPVLRSAEIKPTSTDEFVESERTRRQQRRWRTNSVELINSRKSEEHHSFLSVHLNLETPQDKQKALDSKPIRVKFVMSHTKFRGDEKYTRRKKMKSKQSETTSKESKHEKEHQELPEEPPPQQEGIFQEKQLRRSLRLRLAKPEAPDPTDVENSTFENEHSRRDLQPIKPVDCTSLGEEMYESLSNSGKRRRGRPPKRACPPKDMSI